ncbi:Uncharacterised protein [Yersinia intermedia]|nr:Uncharacterised protein [Yersinia intermedia]
MIKLIIIIISIWGWFQPTTQLVVIPMSCFSLLIDILDNLGRSMVRACEWEWFGAFSSVMEWVVS